MESDLFHNSRLKLERATQHILELNARLDGFLKTDFYNLRVEKDGDLNVLEFKPIASTPQIIPSVIGDAIHNLRAALDNMMWELATLCGQPSPDDFSFPVCKTGKRKEFKGIIKDKKIHALGSDFVDLFLNRIKPYIGGNDRLCDLHNLDITDKHKQLIPVFSVAALTEVSFCAGSNVFSGTTFIVEQGRILKAVRTASEIEIMDYGKPQFKVAFGKGQPFDGEPIVPTLCDLLQLVSSIIQDVEHTYLARK